MFKLSSIDPIILDVSFIVLLVLITFFGVIRGIKSVLINFALVLVSLFLGFTRYTNTIKFVIVDKLIKLEGLLPAGSTTAAKFGASMLSNIIGSISVSLLFYIVLRLIAVLISLIIKRRNVNREKGLKSKVGRVFGGLINLVYGFAIIMFVLFTMNNNIIGGEKLIDKSTVTKKVVDFTEEKINKLNKDFMDMTVLKISMGDVLYDIDFETIDAYHYLDERAQSLLIASDYINKIDSTKLESSELNKLAKDRIYDLYNLSVLTERFSHNNPNIKGKFAKMYDEWMVILNKNCTTEKVELTMNEAGKIQAALEEAGITEEKITSFKNIIRAI